MGTCHHLLKYFMWLSMCFIHSFNAFGQQDELSQSEYIQQLIEDDSLEKARSILKFQLDSFRSEKNKDSLVAYVFLVGSFKLANGDHDLALKKTLEFGEELKRYNDPYIDKEFLMELSWIYDDAGHPEQSYQHIEHALAIAKAIKDPKKAGIDVIYHNLGYQASNMGNYELAKQHYKKAITIMEEQSILDYESLQKTYNALGGMMWFSSKLDSSKHYFSKALKMLELLDSDKPIDTYYRPALVKLNLAVLSHATGRIDQAITLSEEVVDGFQKYLNVSNDESRKLRALKHQLAAIDNLGSFYHSIGEFQRANDLISYAYDKKVESLAPEDHNITISQIILAQAKFGIRDFEAANSLIDEALNRIENSTNMQLYWHAGALSAKSTISFQLKDTLNALKFREASNALYRKSLGNGDYNREFLDEIIQTSLLYAETNHPEKAISYAMESYDYIKQSDFKDNIQGFHHILNLSEVYFKLHDYKNAIVYADEALQLFSNLKTKTSVDSIQIQYRKPKALFIQSKSKYQLHKNKDISFLKSILKALEEGIAILEQRKTQITSIDDLNLLIAENQSLFSFAKQILYDLYLKTDDESYLNTLLSFHESALYNRIRNRLSLKNMDFAGIPSTVIEKENSLKRALKNTIETSEDGSLNTFFETNEKWQSYLDSLKISFPKYYAMRYASIKEPFDNIKNLVPEGKTVIRYLFIEKELYALHLSKNHKTIYPLDHDAILPLLKNDDNDLKEFEALRDDYFKLYQTLWQPFESEIDTEDVIIIPDAELFNLSFETITPKRIEKYADLLTHSLLAKYSISYNYSLLLLNTTEQRTTFNDDFIAFAPEFNKKMKTDYKLSITDSISMDKTYLNLLPQPFSVDLAKTYSKVFDGKSFINENASKTIFNNEANEHKIIHIGTHAESNNVSPELSRLIFAKSLDSSNTDNYLYTFEIYNQNLASNLAILTACETGKPSYQAGEGMISLAHAFNYAGSESMLTSLWKIDEQSSTQIIKLFYDNLAKGMAKDESLKMAKLEYLKNAQGRTSHPIYWAGLVLIGDTYPIEFSSSTHLIYWLLIVVIAILLFATLKKYRSRS